MEGLLVKIGPTLEIVAYVALGLVIVGTIVAQFTRTLKDDEIVNKAAGYVLKFIRFLPTLGANPATKKLEEAYIKLQEEKKDEPKV